MILQKKLDAIFLKWLYHLDDEIYFWDEYLKTGGLDWADDYRNRIHIKFMPPRYLIGADVIEDFAKQHPHHHIRILDVGAGPLTCIGQYMADRHIEVVASDPLAPIYDLLFKKYQIEPPIAPVFADGENLALFFEKNYFDIIFARDALDHAYNPAQCICQMVELVKPDGVVMLSHGNNRAAAANYRGILQWNFTDRGDDLVIWNNTSQISLKGVLGERAAIDLQIKNRAGEGSYGIWCQIKKTKPRSPSSYPLSPPLSPWRSDMHQKYSLLAAEFISRRISEPLYDGRQCLRLQP